MKQLDFQAALLERPLAASGLSLQIATKRHSQGAYG